MLDHHRFRCRAFVARFDQASGSDGGSGEGVVGDRKLEGKEQHSRDLMRCDRG